MKPNYTKPDVCEIRFTAKENLMLTTHDLTPSNVTGGFDERNN